MNQHLNTVITGTGSYIPDHRVKNKDFLKQSFYDKNGESYDKSNEEIIDKFQQITGIRERRYAKKNQLTSDLAFHAAKECLDSSGTDPEELDYIIVAHNFGDLREEHPYTDQLPALASRVKHKLKIHNPDCIPYDLPFGCPGWVQGVIQANYYIKAGDARKVLVIGAETLSRIYDPHDRDSMIYSDGAGATLLEARESEEPVGVINHAIRNDTRSQAFLLWMDDSFDQDKPRDRIYLKMNGHKLYQYALKHVPDVIKKSLDKAGLDISDISKVLIHQANEKMDEAILKRTFKLYDQNSYPEELMPMTIGWLGNSSVATVPTMLDLIEKGKMEGHSIESGQNVIMASVGAGMNINSIVYRKP